VVAGSYQSLSWGSAAIGGIVSSYFSGSLIETYGVSFVFGITAIFPLMVSLAALLIHEKRVRKSDSHLELSSGQKSPKWSGSLPSDYSPAEGSPRTPVFPQV
jgi:hypothetical protein